MQNGWNMHIKCVHNISHEGINGQKMQGTTGGKQTLCLDEILGRIDVARICLLRQKFGQNVEISMKTCTRIWIGIFRVLLSQLLEHAEVLVYYWWGEIEIDYRIHRTALKLAPSGLCLYLPALFVSKQKDTESLIIPCLWEFCLPLSPVWSPADGDLLRLPARRAGDLLWHSLWTSELLFVIYSFSHEHSSLKSVT